MQGGVIMWRSSAYSAAIVCGPSVRSASASNVHIPRSPRSRKLNAANTRSSCLLSICGTRACRPLAQASCRLTSEQGPVVLGPPQRSRGYTATLGSEGQAWPGRALSARRFYRHSRRLAGGGCHWLSHQPSTAPAINKRQVDTQSVAST